MVNWKDIHPQFTEDLAQSWQEKGFDFEDIKKWIELGFELSDYDLVSFVKNELGYNQTSVQENNMDIETLRLMFQESLTQQTLALALSEEDLTSQLTGDDLVLQQTLLFLQQETAEANVDMGWLTDDNIIHILKNDEVTRQVENIQIKTDIANIYFQIEKAKNGEKVDNDFWSSLNTKKKYVILPLRVSGNHWSMLLFINNEYTGEVNWIYYFSSLGELAVSKEITEITNFLRQTGERFGSDNNKIINENNLAEMVFQENPRQPNTWDCGVYICLFIKFLCNNEYYNLNGYQITPQEVAEFRNKWRKEIGEDKWCKWDEVMNKPNAVEEEELAQALSLSLSILPSELSPTNPQEVENEKLRVKIMDLQKRLAWVETKLAEEEKKNQLLREQLEAVLNAQIEVLPPQ